LQKYKIWRPHEDPPRLDLLSAARFEPRRRAMIAALLVAQLTIVATGPPLKPADAAATLRRASPDLDLSRGLFPLDALPVVINITRPANDDRRQPGEVVPLDRVTFERRPLGRVIPGITYSLPWGWWRAPRTRSEEPPRRHRSR
jgi:hypothetical protein